MTPAPERPFGYSDWPHERQNEWCELHGLAKEWRAPKPTGNGPDPGYVPPGEPAMALPPPFTRKVKRGGDFLAEYTPIVYAIDGVLPSGSIYALTARTGGGKTALCQGLTLSGNTGKNLIGFDVEQGRVAYVVLENPADFRMKLAVNCYIHGVDWRTLNEKLAIIDMRLPHAEIMEQLRIDGEENGPFRLVFYDTFQAGFAGAQFNANKDVLKHAIDLRQLTTLPGQPGIIVPAHPVKNAAQDNLVPFGGGATVNEFDGNLWLWAENGRIEMGWTKVRGPEPEKRFFSIEKLGSPDILDSKGRQPLLPVIRAMSTETAEQRAKTASDSTTTLLQIIANDPKGTQREWGMALGSKPAWFVSRELKRLGAQRLVEELAGKWRLTSKGKRALKNDEI